MKVTSIIILVFLSIIETSLSIESFISYNKRFFENLCQSDKVNDETIENLFKCGQKSYWDDLHAEQLKWNKLAAKECYESLTDKLNEYTGITNVQGKNTVVKYCFTKEFNDCFHEKFSKYQTEWRDETMTKYKDLENCELAAVGAEPLSEER